MFSKLKAFLGAALGLAVGAVALPASAQDLTSLTTAVDFTTVVAAVILVGAAAMALILAGRGVVHVWKMAKRV